MVARHPRLPRATPQPGATCNGLAPLVWPFGLPAGSRDAALAVFLRAGASYTVMVSGADGGTGEALVEIYELP